MILSNSTRESTWTCTDGFLGGVSVSPARSERVGPERTDKGDKSHEITRSAQRMRPRLVLRTDLRIIVELPPRVGVRYLATFREEAILVGRFWGQSVLDRVFERIVVASRGLETDGRPVA